MLKQESGYSLLKQSPGLSDRSKTPIRRNLKQHDGDYVAQLIPILFPFNRGYIKSPELIRREEGNLIEFSYFGESDNANRCMQAFMEWLGIPSREFFHTPPYTRYLGSSPHFNGFYAIEASKLSKALFSRLQDKPIRDAAQQKVWEQFGKRGTPDFTGGCEKAFTVNKNAFTSKQDDEIINLWLAAATGHFDGLSLRPVTSHISDNVMPVSSSYFSSADRYKKACDIIARFGDEQSPAPVSQSGYSGDGMIEGGPEPEHRYFALDKEKLLRFATTPGAWEGRGQTTTK